jgi:RNA polymerase sigma-70 factor (ECF subfamily)
LYREYGPALLLFAVAITGERSRAQDAVHQVFLKMIEGGKLVKALDKRAYLFRCVRNALLNEAKHQDRETTFDPELAWFTAPNRSPEEEVDLRRALCTLPDDQRQVVILHIWGDLTFLDIAHVLDISSNTVASRYRYALSKLREAMPVKEDSCANS